MSNEPFTLKEALFNHDTVTRFASGIQTAYPAFNLSAFKKMVFDEEWDDRSLLERMHHVTVTLHRHFPGNYRQSLDILLEAQSHLAAGSFVNLVPADFVALYGLDDPDASIPALEQFTQQGSAEFAVRHFIVKYPNWMMAQMLVWADHDHPEVRRLSSEGCRPRLPWGIRLYKLIDNPGPLRFAHKVDKNHLPIIGVAHFMSFAFCGGIEPEEALPSGRACILGPAHPRKNTGDVIGIQRWCGSEIDIRVGYVGCNCRGQHPVLSRQVSNFSIRHPILHVAVCVEFGTQPPG